MTPEDYVILLRMAAIAGGCIVLVLAVGSRVRAHHAERKRELARQWREDVERMIRLRDNVTYHKSTAEWRYNHGPKDAA